MANKYRILQNICSNPSNIHIPRFISNSKLPFPRICTNLDCSKPNWLKIEGVKAWWLSHGKGSAARHGSWCSSPSVITCIQYGKWARGPSDMIGDFVGQKLLNSSPQKHRKTSNDLKFPPASVRLAISVESFDAWKNQRDEASQGLWALEIWRQNMLQTQTKNGGCKERNTRICRCNQIPASRSHVPTWLFFWRSTYS